VKLKLKINIQITCLSSVLGFTALMMMITNETYKIQIALEKSQAWDQPARLVINSPVAMWDLLSTWDPDVELIAALWDGKALSNSPQPISHNVIKAGNKHLVWLSQSQILLIPEGEPNGELQKAWIIKYSCIYEQLCFDNSSSLCQSYISSLFLWHIQGMMIVSNTGAFWEIPNSNWVRMTLGVTECTIVFMCYVHCQHPHAYCNILVHEHS